MWSEKSIGRGCDRYPNVKGALVTKTLFQIDIESAGFNVPAVSLMMSLGQPRLDSGSTQQAGFPCQMLLWRLLGCHPFAPCSPSSMSLEQLWVSMDCCAINMRQLSWAIEIMQIVTSTVRAKHLCEDVRVRCELSFVVFLAAWGNGKGERLRK